MNKKLNADDLLLMTEQLAILINAALPLIFCLKTLAHSFKPVIRTVFKHMIVTIEGGKNLSAALGLYPQLFPHYFIYLIQVGEESGQLGLVLAQLAAYQEKMRARGLLLKKALLYPLFVFITSLVITLALLLFIVPQFQLLFAGVTNLPLMTRFVFGLSNLLQKIQMIHCVSLILIIVLLRFGLKNNNAYIRIMQELLYRLPIIGKIIHDNQQTRYLRTLSVALQAGLPLILALQLSLQVMQYTRLSRKITWVSHRIQSGMNLKQTLAQTAQFCEIVIQLVAIGEQTSQLPSLLAHSAQVLEQRTDQQMQHLTRLLQPILIVLLGAILGCLIIALYLPVFKLGTLY